MFLRLTYVTIKYIYTDILREHFFGYLRHIVDGFSPRIVHVEGVVDKMTVEQVFYDNLKLPLSK